MSLDILKQGKKAIGVKQATKATEKNRVQIIYIAWDADQRLVEPLRMLCSEKSIAVETTLDMKELGNVCEIEVGAAAVAILKE